jgi:membrane protein
MSNIIKALYEAIFRTIEQDGIEHAGYMSFMILFSLFPFIIFFLALTSFIGASELGGRFIIIFFENMPYDTTISIKARIDELLKTPPQRLMTLAIFGSIWTASSFVECVRTILNKIYQITSPPNYIIRRLLSIFQFLLISIFIIVAMFILVFIPIIFLKIPNLLTIVENYKNIFDQIRYFLIFASLFFVSSFLYYMIPNMRLNFKNIVPGSCLTAISWMLSGYLLSKYIKYYNQLDIVYGSLGGIIVTLIFFYIINMLFIYGAEFNYLYKLYSSENENQIRDVT